MNSLARKDAWLAMPLCRHYFSAHFDQQPIQVVAADGASQELKLIWALGLLRDGDWSLLGAWLVSDVQPAFWRDVFDEFAVHGVERMSFALADAVADVGDACPGAQVLPPFTRVQSCRHDSRASGAALLGAEARRVVREAASARGAGVALARLSARSEAVWAAVVAADWSDVLTQLEPFYALRSERRALVRRGDEALEHLGRSLSRAVGRHGPFADVDAAVSFVGRTLARAESRFSSFVPPAARLRARFVSRMAARAGVAVPGH